MLNHPQNRVPFGEPFPSVAAAVAALTQPQLDRLRQIAQRRIGRLAEAPPVQRLLGQCGPEDFVQEAIVLVLLGEAKPGEGRRVRPRHLADAAAFFNFLQGVIQSCISSRLKTVRFEGEHRAPAEEALPAPRTVLHEVQLNEVRAALVARLSAAAGGNPDLQSALALLELETPAGSRTPSRRQLHHMRQLGRSLLHELAGGEDGRTLLQA